MPVETLNHLETKSLNADLYLTELNKNQQIVPLYSAPDSSKIVLGGIVIFVLGVLAGLAIR